MTSNRHNSKRVTLLGALLLGVFISLGATLTAHIFSFEHQEHIYNSIYTHPNDLTEDVGACVLSLFNSLSFDGIETPIALSTFWSLVDEFFSLPDDYWCSYFGQLWSSRAPPFTLI